MWELRCTDSIQLLKTMAANCVDHCISDPPYDDHVHSTHGHRTKRNGFRDTEAIPFDALQNYDFVLDILRVTKRWTVLFCAGEQLGDYRKASHGAYMRGMTWIKTNAMPQFSKDRPGQGTEHIAAMHLNKKKMSKDVIEQCGGLTKQSWNGGSKHGIYRHPMPHPDKRFHPTEKPIPLLIELLEDFTKPGETIFDPFAGSASLGLACLMTGRKYLGIEINKDFHTRAMKRLQRASTGLSREKYKNAKQIGLFANG